MGVGVELGLALTEGLGISVGVAVGKGVCIGKGVGVGKGVVVGGAVGVKVGVGTGVGVAVGVGIGVGVGTGLTGRSQPNRNSTRRKMAIFKFRTNSKHLCEMRFKLQALKSRQIVRRKGEKAPNVSLGNAAHIGKTLESGPAGSVRASIRSLTRTNPAATMAQHEIQAHPSAIRKSRGRSSCPFLPRPLRASGLWWPKEDGHVRLAQAFLDFRYGIAAELNIHRANLRLATGHGWFDVFLFDFF